MEPITAEMLQDPEKMPAVVEMLNGLQRSVEVLSQRLENGLFSAQADPTKAKVAQGNGTDNPSGEHPRAPCDAPLCAACEPVKAKLAQGLRAIILEHLDHAFDGSGWEPAREIIAKRFKALSSGVAPGPVDLGGHLILDGTLIY